MASKEKTLTNSVLRELGDDERLFRINAGAGWTGQVVSNQDGLLVMKNPRRFIGAPKGWPDLAGWKTVTVTKDMVGKKLAVFVGKEVKATGKLSKVQEKFRDLVKQMGGIYRVVTHCGEH